MGKPAPEDGEEKPAKPEETVEAQEGDEEAEKPAKGEGEKPAPEDGEEKPEGEKRQKRCRKLADAAEEVADEAGLTDGDKADLKADVEENGWEAFDRAADKVGNDNAGKLFEK